MKKTQEFGTQYDNEEHPKTLQDNDEKFLNNNFLMLKTLKNYRNLSLYEKSKIFSLKFR